MKQIAIRAGVIGRRYIESGEQFDHAERMKWATPIEEPKQPAKPDKVKPKPGPVESSPPGDDEVI
jgi:hypothetical protein